jgi:rRNA maturation protein Nop10
MKLKTFEDITSITGTPTDQKIVNGVRDILIELEDQGFLVEVGNADYDDMSGETFIGDPLNIDVDGLLMVEIIKRIPGQQYENFKYSDISEYILTVIDFMKEEWTYVKVIYNYETFNLEDGFKRYRDSKPKLNEEIQKLKLFIRKEKPTMLKRFLKKFEAFSMNVDVCPRCGESTNNQTTMSVFNTDTICIPCKDKEKEDPDYQLAVDTEAAEVRKGNYNYPGIYPNYKPLD